MSDNRRKDVNWNVGATPLTWPAIHAALLMDIRDELKQLNRTIGCPNFVQVPAVLRSIRRNTAKPRKKRRAKP